MRRAKECGPGPSHLLLTPDHAGNVVGIDPHKRTLTATIVDPRGGILASEHLRVSGDGHRALEAWARQFGQIARLRDRGLGELGPAHDGVPDRPPIRVRSDLRWVRPRFSLRA